MSSLNNAQLYGLKLLIEQPEHAALYAAQDWRAIAARLNAPPWTEADNPDPQGTVRIAPSLPDLISWSVDENGDDVPPVIPIAERQALRDEKWSTVVSAAADLILADPPPAWADALDQQVSSIDATIINDGLGEDPEVYAVGRWLTVYAPELIEAFLTVLVRTGYLSAETGQAILATMQVPDPDWQPTLYTDGMSVAVTAGLGWIEVEDVQRASLI